MSEHTPGVGARAPGCPTAADGGPSRGAAAGADPRPAGRGGARTARSTRPLPVLVVERPRCPNCGGADLRKHRTIADQGDGTALWWVTCRGPGCGHRFRVLLE
jgi:hypothetical protein